MNFEFTWKIIAILPCEFVWAKWTAKQDFVVEEVSDKEKKQSVCLTAWWQTTEYLSKRNVWDIVSCKLSFSSREYNWKFYNSISTFWIKVIEESKQWNSTHVPATENMPAHDDLPFN